MMDIVYVYRRSASGEFEIRYSLRSVEEHLPFLRKVWVFGDRPEFIADDKTIVEHVPGDYLAWAADCRAPVKNCFLQLFLTSLIPELSAEYLWFADDYFILSDLSEEDARRTRYVEDLSQVERRPIGETGLWVESLIRTFDVLERLGYTGWNFESHTPTLLTKKRVFEAYRDLRDFVTEDRFYGLLAPTAILNHAYHSERMELTSRAREGKYVGFHGRPPEYEAVRAQCAGKTFLNFDDEAFGDSLKRFLVETFPHRSRYERESQTPSSAQADEEASHARIVRERIFGSIYRKRQWQFGESLCGWPSTITATEEVRNWLAHLIKQHNIRTMVDLGCGDWNWMRLLMLQVDLDSYVGYDIVPELVQRNNELYGSARTKFIRADVTDVILPPADLILCRLTMGHLSFGSARLILAAVERCGAKLLAATTFPRISNGDAPDGTWRPINLHEPPFRFPHPIESVRDGVLNGACEYHLALFRTDTPAATDIQDADHPGGI